MTPEEKAIELVDCLDSQIEHFSISKECACIAVDEIIDSKQKIVFNISGKSLKELEVTNSEIILALTKNILYWEEVKQQIEKL